MLHTYCSTEAWRTVSRAHVQCDSPICLKSSSRWMCPHWQVNLQIMYSVVGWLWPQVSFMCLFSSWAISCSRSPTGRSCRNKYWGCEVTLWKMARHSCHQRLHEGNGDNWRSGSRICWTEWYEIPSCLAPLIVNLLVLCWIDTLKALILHYYKYA